MCPDASCIIDSYISHSNVQCHAGPDLVISGGCNCMLLLHPALPWTDAAWP